MSVHTLRALRVQSREIKTYKGPVWRPVLVDPHTPEFFAHESLQAGVGFWTVTHARTGLAVCRSVRGLVEAFEIIDAIAGDSGWNLPDPKAIARDVRELVQRALTAARLWPAHRCMECGRVEHSNVAATASCCGAWREETFPSAGSVAAQRDEDEVEFEVLAAAEGGA